MISNICDSELGGEAGFNNKIMMNSLKKDTWEAGAWNLWSIESSVLGCAPELRTRDIAVWLRRCGAGASTSSCSQRARQRQMNYNPKTVTWCPIRALFLSTMNGLIKILVY
jgi:hypothetical protein